MDRSLMKVVIGIVAGGFIPFFGGFMVGGISCAFTHFNFFAVGIANGLSLAGWGMVAGAIGGAALVVADAIKAPRQ